MEKANNRNLDSGRSPPPNSIPVLFPSFLPLFILPSFLSQSLALSSVLPLLSLLLPFPSLSLNFLCVPLVHQSTSCDTVLCPLTEFQCHWYALHIPWISVNTCLHSAFSPELNFRPTEGFPCQKKKKKRLT